MEKFGKLELVEIRKGWSREDTEFTPWLAVEENLALLGAEIKIDLELVETESEVGSYRADILAKRKDSGDAVVIENQFGNTDHSHLGQLLTYAAGVGAEGSGAKTIIWIAEHFSEPHRAALDWLNKCTEPGIRFFAVELQLWRIGDSPYAPKFNVVSRPNIWQKEMTQQTAILSKAEKLYQEFWASFIEFCIANTTLDLPQVPPLQHWLATGVGRAGFGVNLTVSKKFKRLECQLWLENVQAKPAFLMLREQAEAIRAKLGQTVEFDEMPGRTSSKIFQTTGGDVEDRSQWPTIQSWLKERGEAYVAVFKPLIKELNI